MRWIESVVHFMLNSLHHQTTTEKFHLMLIRIGKPIKRNGMCCFTKCIWIFRFLYPIHIKIYINGVDIWSKRFVKHFLYVIHLVGIKQRLSANSWAYYGDFLLFYWLIFMFECNSIINKMLSLFFALKIASHTNGNVIQWIHCTFNAFCFLSYNIHFIINFMTLAKFSCDAIVIY